MEAADAQDRGLQVQERALHQSRGDLPAEPAERGRLMGDHHASGALHGGLQGVEVHRGERAQVDHLEGPAVLLGGLRGGQGHRHQGPPRDDGRIASLPHGHRTEGAGLGVSGGGAGVHLAAQPVAALGLEDDHGVLALDGLAGHPVGVMRVGRGDHAQSGGVREQRLRGLRVVLDGPDAAAVRDADGHRDLAGALGAGAHLGQLRGDLVEPGEDEAVELDLRHRAVAAHGQADRGADDPGLGQGRVHHTVGAEGGLQSLRHAVHPAQRTDVLAHQQDLFIRGELVGERAGDRLGDRQGLGLRNGLLGARGDGAAVGNLAGAHAGAPSGPSTGTVLSPPATSGALSRSANPACHWWCQACSSWMSG